MVLRLLPFFLFVHLVVAQTDTMLNDHIFQVDTLEDQRFVAFIAQVSQNSQFILIGEQHGIKEVGGFTNAVFDLVHKNGFNTLCIETDALAAEKIKEIAASETPLKLAETLDQKFPLAIPFYGNASDYELFVNVVSRGGNIWGIDQTFMAQFRLNFDHLSNYTTNPALKKITGQLKNRAQLAFEEAFKNKSFGDMFVFKYSDTLHDSLLATDPNPKETEILNQLKKTKEIYGYNASKQYYQNNNVRGQLMKANFNAYYKEALKSDPIPKVVFKLGATHATRGLSMTKIYDVSNYLSELAVFNDKRSLHFMVAGITGTALAGNPFMENPITEFNNTKQLPEELQAAVDGFDKKYSVIHLEPLREKSYGNRFSENLKTFIFNYDVLVLVNNAEALVPFRQNSSSE
ncbi:MAG: hypothetical protein AAF717_15000 [Bacteroidota bacterium]